MITMCIGATTLMAQQQQPVRLMTDPGSGRQWADYTVSRMDLREKIGQLLIYTVQPRDDKQNKTFVRTLVKKYKVGGLLFDTKGGDLPGQVGITNFAQSASSVPLLISMEAEAGLSDYYTDVPQFPSNAALGCIRDNNIIMEYGKEVARELREVGVQVNFAPVADVNMNLYNPVINVRSFSADPKEVAEKTVAYARGLESGGVLSVAKYFPGMGDTRMDHDLTVPVLPFSRQRLDSVELYPFKQLIRAGVGGVTTGHIRVSALEPTRGIPSSLSPKVVTGFLKNELGFRGLVFSDKLGRSSIATTPDVVVKALKAGNDMVLVPANLDAVYASIMRALASGELTEKEITDKCRKVLEYKFALGLTPDMPPVSPINIENRVNTQEGHVLAAKLRLSAITVARNYGHALPLLPKYRVAILSMGESDRDTEFVNAMKQYATVDRFRVGSTSSPQILRTIFSRLQGYQRVIVSVTGSENEVKAYSNFLSALNLQAPLVYVFFSPYTAMKPLQGSIGESAAVILAHSSQPDVQKYTAGVLYARNNAHGRLSMDVGNVLRHGNSIVVTPEMATGVVSEDYGMKSHILHAGIDSIVNGALRAGAFPGCQVLVLKNGRAVYDKTFGTHSPTDKTPVKSTDMFDLSSLTETTGTLLAVMKLYDEKKLTLNDRASQYLPYLRNTNKADITIRDLLFHESGLPAVIRFYREAIDDDSFYGPFTQGYVDDWHRTKMGYYTWACNTFKFKQGVMSDRQTATHNMQMADKMWLHDNFKKTIMNMIAGSERHNIRYELPDKRYINSEINSILLQQVIEAITGMSLDKYLINYFYTPMGLSRTMYLPLRRYGKQEIMPTAANDYLRRQDLCGYVQNEAAACLGGVAGNAGLFSNALEVAKVHQMIMNGGVWGGKRLLSAETCRLFTTAKSSLSRRGLGFDRANPKNPLENPCSPSAPVSVYGMSGPSGTCVWVDPVNEFIYVFLSNRMCPQAWNDKIYTMNVRPAIQEVIYKSLK